MPQVLICLYRVKHEKKIFLSETLRPRAMIFGILHHLVGPYRVCYNNAPGAKNGPAPGVPCMRVDPVNRRFLL